MIWKHTKSQYGDDILVLHKFSQSGLVAACNLAAPIPGANVNYDDGSVYGEIHTLNLLLKLAGQTERIPERPQPAMLGVQSSVFKLPDYQLAGASLVQRELERGVMLNDDMGLGKTVQALAGLAMLGGNVPVVVLCPAFIRSQWENEIKRWWPMFTGREPKVQVIYPPSDPRSKKLPDFVCPDFIVAFYLDADKAKDIAKSQRRGYFLVIDEVHNVRGYKTQRLDAVRTAATFAQGRLSLTASPLYNKIDKLFPILDFTQPGAWGHYFDFAKRYAGAIEGAWGGVEIGDITNEDELRDRMGYMSIRRVKEDVADQLPFDAKYQTVWLEPPPNNATLLAQRMNGSHEMRIQSDRAVAMFKNPYVLEYILSDRNAGVPSITFTWLREQAENLAAQVPSSCLVLGGMPNRIERINDYLAKCKAKGETPVVIGTMDSIGEGANLQFAKVANFAALDPTPDKIRQAFGRIARMGQTGSVTARLFASKYTYDERLIQILKKKLSEQFKLDGRREKSKDDLSRALSPGAEKDVIKDMLERYKKMRAEEAR